VAAGTNGPLTLQVGFGTAVIVNDHAEQTEQRCQRGAATEAQGAALQASRTGRDQAERALRSLEQSAVAAQVPLRAWH
jgi:hypothetical protein